MSQIVVEKIIHKALESFSQKKGFDLPENFDVELVITRDPSHGDFSTNSAMKLARFAKQKPADLAAELVEEITETGKGEESLDKVVVAGPGFINIYLKKASLGKVLVEAVKKGRKFGLSDFGKGKKVLLEYVSANPTGPLTIAHGRQAAVGDSLARILKASGHEVSSEYYLNDAGRQMNLLGLSLWARYCQQLEIDAPLPEDGYQGEYLVPLAEKLIEEEKDGVLGLGEEKGADFCRKYAGDAIMAGIKQDLADFRVSFDNYFSEQTLYKKDSVQKTLDFLQENDYLYKEDGALWFKSTAFGDDKDRVVKKSTGEFTYLAPDISYHHYKYERGYNRLINFLGPDHHGYIARLKAACQALGHNPEEIEVRIAQLTTLYRGGEPVRMSTRAGEFVTLHELMEEVGVDAARFFFIMRRLESHLDFDLDLAKQKSQDNPVYYLQYAHARIASILKNTDKKVTTDVKLELLNSEEETSLIKAISDFPNILVQASEMLEPYRLADYLRSLAMSFHKFYAKHRVLGDEDDLTQARMLLVEATRIALSNGLELLGISQPESM